MTGLYKDIEIDVTTNHKFQICIRGTTGAHSGNLDPIFKDIKYTFQVCGNEKVAWKDT